MARLMVAVALLAIGLCRPLGAQPALPLGQANPSPMKVLVNGNAVPSCSVSGTLCVFVEDLERCGLTATRSESFRVSLGAPEQPAPITPFAAGAEPTGAALTLPKWRLFIGSRQVPAYDCNGRLLMQALDLSLLGQLDTDSVQKQVTFTSGTAWSDPFGSIFTLEPREHDPDVAPEGRGEVQWQYVLARDAVGEQEIVIAERPPISNKEGMLVGQILARKRLEAAEWVANPGLEETRAYVTSARVVRFLMAIAKARVSQAAVEAAQAERDEAAAREAALKEQDAARREALRRNGSRPLKITDYRVAADERGVPEVLVSVLNLSGKTVTAMEFDLLCFDGSGRPVGIGKEGNRQPVLFQTRLPSLTEISARVGLSARPLTTRVHPLLKRVRFSDGTLWPAPTPAKRRR